MINGLFQSTTIPALEQAVNFGQARHNVLAGNIANIDTPGYRARDLSTAAFQARLKDAIAQQHAPPSTGTMSQNDLPNSLATSNPYEQMNDAFQTILHHDNSDVSLEHQVAELTKNQMQYNMALAVMTQQFRLLQAAISERA